MIPPLRRRSPRGDAASHGWHEFWSKHGERAQQAFAVATTLKADLRERGELDLDDVLLIGEHGAGQDDDE